jgi:hypothetical protein
MGAQVNLNEQLRRLDALGERVRDEVRGRAMQAAESMAARLRVDYPLVTGNLRKGVRVEHGRRGSYVLTRAPHAHLYEWGTPVRKNYTRKGANRGVSKPHNVFVPEAQRTRDTYIDGLTQLLANDIEL